MAAFRYIALNPVKAKLVSAAVDWVWSSTPAHFKKKDDSLVTVKPLLDRVDLLEEFLNMPTDSEHESALAKGQTVGRPLMNDEELAALEKRLGRPLRPGKRGCRAPSSDHSRQQKLV